MKTRLCLFTSVITLFSLLGCRGSSASIDSATAVTVESESAASTPSLPSNPSASETIDESDPLTADVGVVYTGVCVEHSFTFTNETASKLVLNTTDGIRRSCGCTSAKVGRNELEPGESTEITINVSTAGKTNAFRESVQLSWTGDGERAVDRNYVVAGQLTDGLRFDPPALTFSEDDLRKGNGLEVRIVSDMELDWSTLRVNPGVAGLTCEIVDLKSQLASDPGFVSRSAADGMRVRVKVQDLDVADYPYVAPAVQVNAIKTSETQAPGQLLEGHFSVRLELGDMPRLSSKTVRLKYRDNAYSGQVFVKGKASFEQLTLRFAVTQPDEEKESPNEKSRSDDGRSLPFAVSRISDVMHRIAFSIPTEQIRTRENPAFTVERYLDFQIGEQSLGKVRVLLP